VPLNFRLAAPELIELLNNAQAKVLIYDQALADLVPPAGSIAALATTSLESLYLQSSDTLQPPATVGPDDMTLIMYSSGTTGTPKGSVMTQGAVAQMFNRQQFHWDVHAPDTCFYTTSALFHVSGIFAICGPALLGNRTVIAPVFDVGKLLEDSYHYRVTHLALVAVMIDRFLEHPQFRKEEQRHLRFIMYGGAPISQTVINRLSQALPGVQLAQNYGMTEVFGAATYWRSPTSVCRTSTAGSRDTHSAGRWEPRRAGRDRRDRAALR
jgi:acyl-CoA synthetase (AMP-forming)/AMP-acid ligase II